MLEAGGGSILVGFADYAVSYFSGMAAAFVAGKVQKGVKAIPNDTIPGNNAGMVGAGAGVVTQDPAQALAAIAGSLTATGLHQLWKKIRPGW